MTRTAIVPLWATIHMLTNGIGISHAPFLAGAWPSMVNARPAVPDELIEEAAKAIYYAEMGVTLQETWEQLHEEIREDYRGLARAAARVFNGGKDD